MNKVKEKQFRNPVYSLWITSKCKNKGGGDLGWPRPAVA